MIEQDDIKAGFPKLQLTQNPKGQELIAASWTKITEKDDCTLWYQIPDIVLFKKHRHLIDHSKHMTIRIFAVAYTKNRTLNNDSSFHPCMILDDTRNDTVH